MSFQGANPSQSDDHNRSNSSGSRSPGMNIQPSVGRFNGQVASLYVKGSSAGLTTTGGVGHSLAPQSNHGLLCPKESPRQESDSSDIVDLKQPAAKLSKLSKGKKK